MSAYSREAEQAVLSSMLMAGEGETVDKLSMILSANHFYIVEHQAIWKAMQALRLKGQEIDPVMIYETDESCNLDYMVDICTNYATSANAVHYAMIVKERAQERAAVTALYDAIEVLSNKDGGLWKERLKRAENAVLSALSESKAGSTGLVHVADIAKQWTKDLVDRIDGVKVDTGYTTGIPELDDLFKPKNLVKGSLVVIGARPKMGKSALLTMLADHFCSALNLQTAIFSMEMPDNQVWERLLTGGTKMSPTKFYNPLTSEDYYSITQYTSSRMKAPLFIDDTPGATIGHIKSEARKLARKGQVGLICVDYLTLMEAGKADRNDLAYGTITKELKNLSRELGCVVLLLTQLNRKIEERPIMDRRPAASDSRDTGQIEQDCDVWIGLFRAGAYDPECPHPGLTEVIVRLNRHGKCGSVFLNMKEGFFVRSGQMDGEIQNDQNKEYISPAKKQGRGFKG